MANAAITVDLNARIAQFETELKKATGTLDNFGKKGDQIAAGFKNAFGSLGLSIGAGLVVRQLSSMADEFSSLQARLKLASRDMGEFNAANADLIRISQSAQAPLSEAATLYTRIAASVKDLDVSQRAVADTTEAVALALKISGASGAEASSAMLQFSQAMASGVLRGEEFNSINEAAPRLLQALAASLDVPVGSLREMSKEGQLTRDVLINGLLSELPTLQAEAETLPKTIGAAFTDLNNTLLLTVGELNKVTGASSAVGEAISNIGTTGIEALAVLGANVAFVFKGVGREIGGIGAQLSRLIVGDFTGFSAIGKMMKADAAQARKELDEFEKKILGAGAAASRAASAAAGASVAPIAAKASAESKKIAAEALARSREHAALIARYMDREMDAAIKLQAAMVKAYDDKIILDRVDAEKMLSDEIDRTIDILDERALAESDSFEALEDLIGGIELETEMIGMSNEAREEAIALRTLEAEGINLSAEALDEYRERLSAAMNSKQAASAAKESADTAAAEWKRASDDIERSLTDALMRGFEGGKGWASNFADTLKNMFSTLVLRPLLQPIAQGGASMTMGALGMGSSGASAGGLLSSGSSLLSTGGAAAGYMGSLGTMASYTGAALSGGAIAGATQGGMLAAQTASFGAFGASSTASALGGASAALAAVPVAGWAALAALAIFGLSGQKPSDKSGWSEVDLGTGESLGTGGLEGKKFSQENRDAAKATTDVGAAWAQLLTDLGAEIGGALKIEIGDRDGFKADLDGDGAWDFIEKDSEIFFDKLFDGLTNSATGLDSALKDMLVSFDGTTEQMLEFAGALVAIRDYTSADLMTDALDQIEQAGRSTWQTWQSSNTELRTMAANFDGSLASATELANASANMYQLELNLIGQIQGLLQSTNAMFGNSIEQIQLSVMDTSQQYDYWRTQTDDAWAALMTATDPAEIARLSGRVDQSANMAWGLLDEDQKPALAPEFIAYLEGADELTTERLNASQDAIVATHADLTTAIESVMTQVAEKMMAAAEISLAAAQTPVTVLVRGDDGYRDPMTPIGEVG